jgi:hypothetical protein
MGILDVLIGPITKLLDKIIPDPQAKAQAKLDLMKLAQEGELKQLEADMQMALAQIDVNKIEAASPNLFKSGWRPAVGWTCVCGLIYTYIGNPLLSWYSASHGLAAPPQLDLGTLITLLGGLLGLGTLRTQEKLKGKA